VRSGLIVLGITAALWCAGTGDVAELPKQAPAPTASPREWFLQRVQWLAGWVGVRDRAASVDPNVRIQELRIGRPLEPNRRLFVRDDQPPPMGQHERVHGGIGP